VPPDELQPVAPPVDQASVAACPACRVDGVAVKELIVAALAGGAVTVTTTELGPALPPGPVQVSVYVIFPVVVIGPALKPGLDVGMDPCHMSPDDPPLAAQDVALVLDHASVVVCPVVTVVGLAVNVLTTAAEGPALVTLTMTELDVLVPPGPVQVSVYV
jgi:hypothetical protein